MGRKTILLLIVGVLGAYYVYTPLPDNIEEPWKLMWVTTCLKTMTHLIETPFFQLFKAKTNKSRVKPKQITIPMTFCQDGQQTD
ncbi:arylacetamide deacetylase-like [Bubalus bubalis]|uniref:arylacetamide deacetylase-like n=1 Tax=Bubalus bubalis TaxID=89462 RepID=UPI00042CC48E|nr:arylacetamide deacetylase-like [Bubalus bubalis]XP_045022217.1 arylacetamide deacetylase-like [Bubalus bubalis]